MLHRDPAEYICGHPKCTSDSTTPTNICESLKRKIGANMNLAVFLIICFCFRLKLLFLCFIISFIATCFVSNFSLHSMQWHTTFGEIALIFNKNGTMTRIK